MSRIRTDVWFSRTLEHRMMISERLPAWPCTGIILLIWSWAEQRGKGKDNTA